MAESKLKVIESEGQQDHSTGDLKFWDGSGWAILSPGTSAKALTSNGTGSAPSWESITPVIPVESSSSSSVSAGVQCYAEGELPIPSMSVTVSGNTSDVNWCGETWTPAESGVVKEVCPGINYSINKNTTSASFFIHEWHADHLLLDKPIYTSGSNTVQLVFNAPADVSGSTDAYSYVVLNYSSESWSVSSRGQGGNPYPNFGLDLSTLTPVTCKFGANFFSSYTTSNGVTFSWGKSAEWDAIVQSRIDLLNPV
jgi:hypothetical protein